MKTIIDDKTFNGHKDYEHWNVSVWITNDEYLYRLALASIEEHPGTIAGAVADFRAQAPARTPDGVRFTKDRVTAVFKDLIED